MADEELTPDPDETKGNGKDEIAGLTNALTDERRKRQTAEVEAAELRGQIQGQSTATNDSKREPEAPKPLSAAELRAAVTEGRITEDEADNIREKQIEKRLEKRLSDRLDGALSSRATAQRVSDEIVRYKQAVPDILDRDSPAFKKLRTEFDYMVSLGNEANDPRTELLAARAAFGDIAQLETVAGQRPRETHSETGGHAEPTEAGGKRSDGWPKDMPEANRRYYQDLINKGIYRDQKSAVEEYQYKPKHQPRVLGAA